MFTGIVEEVGMVESIQRSGASAVLDIQAHHVMEDAHVGDSIAVNGVCLTVTEFHGDRFKADVMHETMDRSTLGELRHGSLVNLERAMAAQGRFGGHIVSGHIDGVGTITQLRDDANAVWYTITAAPRILAYIVEKGSICIEGISLTVARVSNHDFSVSVIPHTRSVTNLAFKRRGDKVNLENDIIGKYVERLMSMNGVLEDPLPEESLRRLQSEGYRSSAGGRSATLTPESGPTGTMGNLPAAGGITEEFLRENGF